MFESGNWRRDSDDEDESEDEEDDGILNLDRLRQETEAIQARKEEERLAKQYGVHMSNGDAEDADGPSEETAENGESSGAAEESIATT